MHKKDSVFFADSMLASLCRRLRMFGYPCTYSRDITPDRTEPSDDEIIRYCARHGLVFLTRDEALAARAKSYARTVFLESMSAAGQLAEASSRLGLDASKQLSQSRCPKCNSEIVRVPKKSVRGLVWPKVYSQQRAFWKCACCGQVYWRGSHWSSFELERKKLRKLSASP